MSGTLSRRLVALALFCAALFGVTPAETWAQRTAPPLPPVRSSTGKTLGNVPLRRFPGMGDMRSVPADVTRRSTAGLAGFDSDAPGTSRVRIGGTNGQQVQEQVVDVTVPYFRPNEITPFWSSDERFLYYASNQPIGTPENPFPGERTPGADDPNDPAPNPDARYRLFRISANASEFGVTANPNQRTLPQALTRQDDATNDYLYPTVNPNNSRIAFLRSSDGLPVVDATGAINENKAWILFVANLPGGNTTIDTEPGLGGDLRPLTADRQPNGAYVGKQFPGENGQPTTFRTVGRPSWVGGNTIIFSARLNDPNGATGTETYHLFQVNIDNGLIFQLTAGEANERNPAVSPDSRNVAFDSDAAAAIGPSAVPVSYVTVGTPRQIALPGNVPTSAATRSPSNRRNLFVMRLVPDVGGARPAFSVTQFSNRHTGATDNNSIEPTWSAQNADRFTNPGPSIGGNRSRLYLGFASDRTPAANGGAGTGRLDIYYALASTDAFTGGSSVVGNEGNTGTATAALFINTGDPANAYEDRNPTFSPFLTVFRIGFQSNRSGNYSFNGFPRPPVGADALGFRPTGARNDLFIATVLDINAPTLIRFDTSSANGNVLHVNLVTDPNRPYNPSSPVRNRDDGILPGGRLHITARVEDRESGLAPDRAVFIQVKNPNSKYQAIQQGSSNPEEHKEYLNRDLFAYTLPLGSPLVYVPFDVRANSGAGPITRSFGPEYEAEALGFTNVRTTDPATGVVTNTATSTGLYYRHPLFALTSMTPQQRAAERFLLYEAGLNDVAAFSGVANPPLDNGAATCWIELKPLFRRNADGSFATDSNGQPIPERPIDDAGGVLYGATVDVPTDASDWYIDVILYDNAINPITPSQRQNWIIYDNVWGFSSAAPVSGLTQDILVVSDYTLGQKFFGSRFNTTANTEIGVRPANNLLPIRFGAESYLTDVSVVRNGVPDYKIRFPDANEFLRPTGTTLNRYPLFNDPISDTASFLGGPMRLTLQEVGSPFGLQGARYIEIPNTLGVKSYSDELLLAGGTDIDGKHLPDTGRYSIWRVLARGPVPRPLLQAYLPQRTTRPADLRENPANNNQPYETEPQQILDVQRLVVWASPFTGSNFTGQGTIQDLQTQNNLTDFVNQGGRLFITGQDIAFALKGNGGTAPNPFFDNVLQARLANDVSESPQIVPAGGASTQANPQALRRDPWSRAQHAYGRWDGTFFSYNPPAGADVFITSSRGSEIADNADRRGDASWTATANSGSNDRVTANPTTPGSAAAEWDYAAGPSAIISSNFGQGRVVYASFGFESLSNGWYTIGGPTSQQYITSLGRRAQIMHNITCSVRTGTISGRLIDNNGAPIPGALVRAVGSVAAESLPAAGTALTDRDGNFLIVGLVPDAYVVFGYRPGYYTQHSGGTLMHGASRSAINLQLKVANPGALSGFPITPAPPGQENNQGGVYRSDRVTPVAGINVEARIRNPDGSITVVEATTSDGVTADPVTGQVLPRGAYRFPSLLIGNYTVIANPATTFDPQNGRTEIANVATGGQAGYNAEFSTVVLSSTANPGFETNEVINPDGTITIRENNTARVNFFLTAAPQRLSGRVLGLRPGVDPANAGNLDDANNPNLVPVANATVTATRPGSTTVIATAVTDANGNYALARQLAPGDNSDPTLLEAGQFVITVVSAPGYALSAPPSPRVSTTFTLTSRDPGVAPNLVLAPLPPGSVSGLVQFAPIPGQTPQNTGVAGVTVQLFVVTTVNGSEQIATTPLYTATVVEPPTTENGYTSNWRLTGVAPGEYLAQVVPVGGLRGNPGQRRITVASGQETRGVNFLLEPPVVFREGLELISVPLDLPGLDPRSVFTFAQGNASGFRIADWTGTEYRIAASDQELQRPIVDLRAGKGYFVRFGSAAGLNPGTRGTRITTNTFDVSLTAGWNLIGHPFASQGDPNGQANDLVLSNPAQVRFTYGSKSGVSLAEAVADGAVQPNAYEFRSTDNGYVARGTITPYVGYWFRTFQAVTVTFVYPGNSTTRAARTPVRVDGRYVTVTREQLEERPTRSIASKSLTDWRLQIAARQGDLKDTDNSVGVAADAKDGFEPRFDAEKPPITREVPTVYLSIEGTGAGGRSTALTDSVLGAGGGRKSWEITVETTDPERGEVTLYWPNVSRLPRGVEPILVDKQTGRRMAMRNGGGGYRFLPKGRAVHRFAVEVAPPSSLPLDILNLRSVVTRVQGGGGAGSNVRLAFAVTREADVEVQVQTFVGRSIRSLRTRAQSGAETSLTWDFRDATGTKTPAGSYVLSVTARDPETGATVRRTVPVMNLN